MHRLQVVLVHERGDVAPKLAAGILVKTIVNAAVDARVGDVIRDLLEGVILERQRRYAGVGDGDVVPGSAEFATQDLGGTVAAAAVIRRPAREARRGNERD